MKKLILILLALSLSSCANLSRGYGIFDDPDSYPPLSLEQVSALRSAGYGAPIYVPQEQSRPRAVNCVSQQYYAGGQVFTTCR